jgi:hypothetical protein
MGPRRTDAWFTLGLAAGSSTTATPPPFGPLESEHVTLCGTASQLSCNAGGGGGSELPCATPEPTGKVEITAIANGFVDGTITVTWDVPLQRLTFHAPLERSTTTPKVC